MLPIEEAQDISKLKVDELIGSLQTFEMGISDNVDKKNKIIALFLILKMKTRRRMKRIFQKL